jgi:hypothetical protein
MPEEAGGQDLPTMCWRFVKPWIPRSAAGGGFAGMTVLMGQSLCRMRHDQVPKALPKSQA